jgi:hypothetical protein
MTVYHDDVRLSEIASPSAVMFSIEKKTIDVLLKGNSCTVEKFTMKENKTAPKKAIYP